MSVTNTHTHTHTDDEELARVKKTECVKTFCLLRCLSSMLSLLQDRVLSALCISLFLFSIGLSLLFFVFFLLIVFKLIISQSSTCSSPSPVCPHAGNFPPQLFLEDLAQSSGLTEGVAFVSLVSLNSIGGGVGKLGLGVMADVPRVNSILLYALTVGVSGLGVLLIPLTR